VTVGSLGRARAAARSATARSRKLALLLRHPAYWRALRHGVAAAVEHEAAALDHPYRTVIDVGANRGQFLLLAARRFPDATLLAFEPLPGPRELLRRVVPRWRPVRLFEVALSDHAGTAAFHVSRADDSSSLLPIAAAQVATFPGTDEVAQVAVRTARLDEVLTPAALQPPVLLKIDAQGGELGVLHGAAGLLEADTTILVECSFAELYEGQPTADDVVRFLLASGFGLHSVGPVTTGPAGRPVQADLVFERAGGGAPGQAPNGQERTSAPPAKAAHGQSSPVDPTEPSVGGTVG
jgi:FkbM family methyltransferase